MAILMQIGIAFGFFIGCSILQSPNKSESETPTRADLEQRLAKIETELSQNPDNAEAYYQKGGVLNKLAHQLPAPENRSDYYREMQQALAKSGSLFNASTNRPGGDKVDELLKVSWSYEHNEGVEILQADSTITSNDYNRAAAHFNNAITIIPDSVVSYSMKAQAHYRNHEVELAIKTLESGYNRIDPLPAGILEQLAFLYLEEDLHEKAIKLYEEAESFSDRNLNLIHGLANAYITAGEHAEAVELLQALVESEPENVIYLESYGTELYNWGLQKYDSLQTISRDDSVALQQTFDQANTLLSQATDQLSKALEQNSDNLDLKKQLAFIHQNYATRLAQAKPLLDEEQANGVERIVEANLSEAISLFEELVAQDPEQTQQYWKQLYQAYAYLGMQQKATEAKEKANL